VNEGGEIEDGEIEIKDDGIETEETETDDTGENEMGEIEGQEIAVGEIEADEIEVGEIEVDENEVGENEVGEGEVEVGEIEVGENEVDENEVGEVEGRENTADLDGGAQGEVKEQRARVETRERARAETREIAHDEAVDPAGRTRSTATPAKVGGEVQLAKIPVIGFRYPNMRLPPGGRYSGSLSIPLDRNAFARHYAEVSSHKKRGHSASPEGQYNKSQRISVSHSSAITRSPSPSVAPSTKWSTRDPSPASSRQRGVRDLSPLLDHDPQGSSSTTGGVFRGRALGSGYRFADGGKLMPLLLPALAYYNIFCPLEQMDVDQNFFSSKISGKVLLYTSRDLGVSPAMTVNHDTVSRLSPVLQKLARRFSPLRSKFVHNGHCDTVLSTLQRWTVASMYLKTRCGPLKVASLKLSLMMNLSHGMYLVKENTLFLSLL
jgi:hypothetical protein